jgi:hypothetical protein
LAQIPRWWNLCDILELEGIHSDVVLGDDEPKEAPNSDAKDTLEGGQVDIILATLLENDA